MKQFWDKFWAGAFWVALGLIIYVVFFTDGVYAHQQGRLGIKSDGWLGFIPDNTPHSHVQPQPMGPLDWGSGTNSGQWGAPAGRAPQGTMISPTIPGTPFVDPSKPGIIFRGGRWQQTIPGTPFADPSKPGYRVQPPQDQLFDYNDPYYP